MKAAIAVFCGVLLPFLTSAQERQVIVLKNEKAPYALHWFYLESVKDSTGRDATSEAVGQVKQNGKPASIVILLGGVKGALTGYFNSNTTHDAEANALSLVFDKFDVTVKHTRTGFTTSVLLGYAIYAGKYKIETFKNEGKIVSSHFPGEEVQVYIRSALKEQLQAFDSIWKTHRESVPLDTMAEVRLTVATTSDSPNAIAYSAGTKLNYDDFKSNDYTAESFAAATSSGLLLEYSSGVEHGKMVVKVKLAAIFYKNKSWFKPEAKVEALLAHEQTHFDLTAVMCCSLAQAIRQRTFSLENFDRELVALLNEYTNAKEQEGVLYDAETDHGLIAEKQHEWQERTNARLKEAACY